MGLGIHLVGSVPRRGLLRRPPSRDQLFSDITQVAAAFADRQPRPLKDWYWASPGDDTLYVCLFPVEENVLFTLEDHSLVCSAKTSTAGPGYHAYMVRFLDVLSSKLGIAWRPEEDEEGDETGYFQTRDFRALQDSMQTFLGMLSRTCLKLAEDGAGVQTLGMPLGFMPKHDGFAASATGVWPREFFERLSAGGDDHDEASRAYFPWWDEGLTASNLRAFGLVRCWMDVRWVIPESDEERWLYESVLECFDAARRLDHGLSLPEPDITELRELLDPNAELDAPYPKGIGYLRGLMKRPLPGGWTVELPGYYSSELEQDGGVQVYWFADRTVRGSSISFVAPEGNTARDALGVGGSEAYQSPLQLRASHLAGAMTCRWSGDDDCFVLQAQVAKRDGLCIVTFWFKDEADRAWAEATAATVFARDS